jgi:hypothetical protein
MSILWRLAYVAVMRQNGDDKAHVNPLISSGEVMETSDSYFFAECN